MNIENYKSKEIESIVEYLVKRDFLSKNILIDELISANDLQRVIEEYEHSVGEKMSMPPKECFLTPMYDNTWEENGEIHSMIEFELWFNDSPGDLCASIYIKKKDDNIQTILRDILVP